jgi:hypothetical protein
VTNDAYEWEEHEAKENAFQERLEQIGRFLPPESESERLDRGNKILLEAANDAIPTPEYLSVPMLCERVAGMHGLPFA